jgi:hypothetical protein
VGHECTSVKAVVVEWTKRYDFAEVKASFFTMLYGTKVLWLLAIYPAVGSWLNCGTFEGCGREGKVTSLVPVLREQEICGTYPKRPVR